VQFMKLLIMHLHLYFKFHKSLMASKAIGYRTCHTCIGSKRRTSHLTYWVCIHEI
jgi:hypothetical protein